MVVVVLWLLWGYPRTNGASPPLSYIMNNHSDLSDLSDLTDYSDLSDHIDHSDHSDHTDHSDHSKGMKDTIRRDIRIIL